MCVRVCVCERVSERERERKRESWHIQRVSPLADRGSGSYLKN